MGLALAMVAVVFHRLRGWTLFGFARLDDHARERFGRSGRWVRDLAALGDAIERLPALARAVAGKDEGPPLGRVAAVLIARVATEESIENWISVARSASVRQLREAIRAGRPRRPLRMRVPGAVRAAFDEAFDLFRAVEGAEASVESFIEALAAEAMVGGDTIEDDRTPPDREPHCGAARVDCDDPVMIERHLRGLVAVEDALEIALSRTLRGASRELGLSARSMRCRQFVRRGLAGHEVLRRAYEEGAIGLEAAQHLARLLRGAALDEEAQRDWVAHVSGLTVKRLRDEARELAKEERTAPMSDSEWYRSIRRQRGRSVATIAELGKTAGVRPVADVFLGLRISRERASQFLAAIDAARRGVALAVASGVERAGAIEIARRMRRIPRWVGLLALLEEFVKTWDVGGKRREEAVYVRDGWRCAAPGCTSRRNLEVHHVKYRSRGGGNAMENLLCLCRFHHQMGEHGGLARCSGRAPLAIVWRLGREDVGEWYQNERRRL